MKKPAVLLLTLLFSITLLGCEVTKPMATDILQTVTVSSIPVTSVTPITSTTSSIPMPTTSNAPAEESTSKRIDFIKYGYTDYGTWMANVVISDGYWQPGMEINTQTSLVIKQSHLDSLTKSGSKVDGFCILLTAERTFDADGCLRLGSDERMSTLLTPTGLAIEGGIQGAVTNRYGYDFRTPVDEYATLPISSAQQTGDGWKVFFSIDTKLPQDLPPGIYRIRIDYGVTIKTSRYNLNGETFTARPFFSGQPTESHLYSPPIRASGKHVGGRIVDANTIQPRIPWVILSNYNSNGYNGVIADEDKGNFALSQRNIIPDAVILPLYDDYGQQLTYSLEPQFPTDTIELRNNIPWDYTKGQLAIQITGPDGKTTDLGTAMFISNNGQWLTTKRSTFTSWKPPSYGYYTVQATGWIYDIWGNKYIGGGTYHFWIAKRMTMATATFQGFAYPVGSKYGRDIGFSPAVPADVEVTASLYVNSDKNNVKTISYTGKATASGIFGAAQGMKQLPLDAPGEYHAQILAKYTDSAGHLWICSMRHAGVVYPDDSSIIARGKKLTINGKLFDRGETNFEGWVESAEISHLAHINFPFQSGDVMLIASEQQGANKIEPVLTYELKNNPAPYDSRLQTIGATNLKLKTSNGYSPHLFPEYITDWAYYYAGAPRPGFMSRFIVAENGTRAPYWPTSPNSFGGQINASNNGDLPGDIYRLIGGVVLRNKGQTPAYAGYLSSAFLLPKGTNNNRIIAPGSEDVIGSDGSKARLFLTGLRPGMMYEIGTQFAPAVQIDPILPVTITFTLTYPDGRKVTASGTGDIFGTFAGKDKWTLDVPGVYRYWLEADWQGHKGYMPGLPVEGGEMYVVEKEKQASVPVLKINLPEQSTFSASGKLTITGSSTASTVHFAMVIPGAVVGQGDITVKDGKWEYILDPVAIASKFPTYDIINLVNGKPEIKDVIHLSFLSNEIGRDGSTCYSFKRLIIRGTTVINAD